MATPTCGDHTHSSLFPIATPTHLPHPLLPSHFPTASQADHTYIDISTPFLSRETKFFVSELRRHSSTPTLGTFPFTSLATTPPALSLSSDMLEQARRTRGPNKSRSREDVLCLFTNPSTTSRTRRRKCSKFFSYSATK